MGTIVVLKSDSDTICSNNNPLTTESLAPNTVVILPTWKQPQVSASSEKVRYQGPSQDPSIEDDDLQLHLCRTIASGFVVIAMASPVDCSGPPILPEVRTAESRMGLEMKS